MSVGSRARISLPELIKEAEAEGHVVTCPRCEGALLRDGRCPRCDKQAPIGPAQLEITPSERRLEFVSFADAAARVAVADPVGYLVDPLWPGDAYGVLGAEDKAGKTWALLDLAISVASGTPWLNEFTVPEHGPVTLFLGEGGERNAVRRIRAICADRGADDDDIPDFRLCYRAPRLRESGDVEAIRAELEAHPAKLVGLDPLYLAAAGARGADLYQMGETLYGVQQVVQDAGAAFAVSTHWNKTGSGSGAQRFTGVGPGAWGRVLGSAAVENRTTDAEGGNTVLLRWEFMGGEIADFTFRMRRYVRAEDPHDLNSALVYNVEITSQGEQWGDQFSPSQSRVLAVLKGTGPTEPLSVREIGDRLAEDGRGRPLTARTIQQALKDLLAEGLVDGAEPGPGVAGRWWSSAG